MLSRSDVDIIEQFVDDKYLDKDKLIKYLNMHSNVMGTTFMEWTHFGNILCL